MTPDQVIAALPEALILLVAVLVLCLLWDRVIERDEL